MLDFVICVDNSGYKASLEPRKIYWSIPDAVAEKHKQIRVIDESGEDYLFPVSLFIKLDSRKFSELSMTYFYNLLITL